MGPEQRRAWAQSTLAQVQAKVCPHPVPVRPEPDADL